MRGSRWIAGLAGALTLALGAVVLAACGSGGYGGSSNTSTPAGGAGGAANTPLSGGATSSPAAGDMSVTVSAVEGSGSPTTAWKFMPASVTVAAGQSITFMNTGGQTHTMTADGGSFDSGPVTGGTSKTIAMPTAGTFTFHCSFHSWMTGTITVTGSGASGTTAGGGDAASSAPAAVPTLNTGSGSGYNY